MQGCRAYFPIQCLILFNIFRKLFVVQYIYINIHEWSFNNIHLNICVLVGKEAYSIEFFKCHKVNFNIFLK